MRRPVATTSDGRRVFVPVVGGNAVSHAVYAVQGPPGQWLLGPRPSAPADVWECV